MRIFFHAIQQAVQRRSLPYNLSSTTIRKGQFGSDASSVGAATMVLDAKLDLVFADGAEEG